MGCIGVTMAYRKTEKVIMNREIINVSVDKSDGIATLTHDDGSIQSVPTDDPYFHLLFSNVCVYKSEKPRGISED